METRFKDASILITGASSGLGQQLAIDFCRLKARVGLMARNIAGLQETQARCLSYKTPLIIPGDVCQIEDCMEAVEKTVQCNGGLDYLILNAGISMHDRFDDMLDMRIPRRLMDVNYFGALHCAHAALPYLKKSKGMIVVISSLQDRLSLPGRTAYSASKHALQGFFSSLRQELKKQVDILIVSPTWIQGTALGINSLGKKKRNRPSNTGIRLSYCSDNILRAIYYRKRELVLPPSLKLLYWLQLLSPRLLDFLIKWYANKH